MAWGTVVVKDFTGPAINFFNNLRVPAALLAASAIKDAFTLQDTPPAHQAAWDREHGITKSRMWRSLRHLYLMLMVFAFALEVNTIFMSTQVSTQLATSRFDAEAESLVSFLVREFEYEYVTIRLQFVSGLLAYVVAQGLRVRFILRKYMALSLSAMLCLFTAAFGMMAYTNANTITYGGFGGLLRRHCQLSAVFIADHLRDGPMPVITVLSTALAIAFAVASVAKSAPEIAADLIGT